MPCTWTSYVEWRPVPLWFILRRFQYSDYVASKHRITGERWIGKVWKETVLAQSSYHPRIWWKGLRKTTKEPQRITGVPAEIRTENLPLLLDQSSSNFSVISRHPAIVAVCVSSNRVLSVLCFSVSLLELVASIWHRVELCIYNIMLFHLIYVHHYEHGRDAILTL
jgi:hypothetical protein